MSEDVDTDKPPTAETKWYTCASVKELSKAVASFCRPGDRVAHLGSQLREVSAAVVNQCDQVVMVDTARKFAKDEKAHHAASRRQEDINNFDLSRASFCEIASLDEWRRALFFANDKQDRKSFDVLILELSSMVGNDLEWTSFSIIREFLALNEAFGGHCHTVLVKSSGLNRLASQLMHSRRWIKGGPTPSHRQPYIVGAVGVHDYRSTVDRAVLPGDAVLEVGCHLGTSTAILDKKAKEGNGGYCLGIDVGRTVIELGKSRNPNLYLAVGDAWKAANLLRIQQDFLRANPSANQRIGFDVVYVDVGGLSGSDGLLEALMLLQALENALEPRCLVIKSLCVTRFSSLMSSFWQSEGYGLRPRQRSP